MSGWHLFYESSLISIVDGQGCFFSLHPSHTYISFCFSNSPTQGPWFFLYTYMYLEFIYSFEWVNIYIYFFIKKARLKKKSK
ncbi:hypothetical protein I7I53_04801 [Histoplasma capsulatum var. duboisii H88]|uniref:Uncharacterized protein n=1 Tax=Ajellomyces capsulatus (strain H88) TaxID=544711 RepID=A0A8A1LVH4_AJEC8|nr:hypothetical protein I7I53_04801 [Histoplasma capsulatum var. duboisii H88]